MLVFRSVEGGRRMNTIALTYLVGGLWIFAVGAVVGSFVNVCVYRIPWQKSVIWPASHCPKCLNPIAARDNVPIVGWLFLRGACRRCGLPISARYPLIEALVGLLFVAVYLTDIVFGARGMLGGDDFLRMLYHLVLLSLLVVATFIDYDLFIIPDEVTVTGMVLGLLLGAIVPDVRPEPGTASTFGGGLAVGLLGWAVGGGLVWAVRIVAGLALRREAMGFGDVTLMAMIGAFLGWQAAVLTFFIAPFFGLAHAVWKLVLMAGKILARRNISGADREIPFGPYLSLAALTLMLSWPWLWPGWARPLFSTLTELFRFLLGREP